MQRQYLLVEVVTDRPVPDLADKVAGRAWPLQGVVSTHAMPLTSEESLRLALAHTRGTVPA